LGYLEEQEALKKDVASFIDPFFPQNKRLHFINSPDLSSIFYIQSLDRNHPRKPSKSSTTYPTKRPSSNPTPTT
jgi:hypothetical protein